MHPNPFLLCVLSLALAPIRVESQTEQPGQLLWSITAGNGAVQSCPALSSNGFLYYSTDFGTVNAVDLEHHSNRWTFRASNVIHASPALDRNGRICIGSFDRNLYVLHPQTGQVIWSYLQGDGIGISAAIDNDGSIIFPNERGKIYSLREDGALNWDSSTAGTFFIVSSPAIGMDGTVYVGSLDNTLYAFRSSGTLKWKVKVADDIGLLVADIRSSPAIGPDGTIYFGADNGKLYAVTDQGDAGVIKWEFTTSGTAGIGIVPFVRSSPAVDKDGSIYVGVGSDEVAGFGRLYGVTPAGQLKWVFNAAGSVNSSPAITEDGLVIVASNDGAVYARRTQDGSFGWVFFPPTPKSFQQSSPTIGPDGTVYIGADRDLYAIKGTAPLASSSWPKFRADLRQTGHVQPEKDSDNDGLPDSWELANGLNPNSAVDAFLDTDGDGMINRDEYRSGSDPRNALSVLKLLPVSFTAAGFKLRFVAFPGKTYTVEARDKGESGLWTKVSSVAAQASATVLEVTDRDATQLNQRFYRLLTP